MFLLGLAASGLLVGLLLGRWLNPGPHFLLEVRAEPGALVLWFDREAPEPRQGALDGALLLLLENTQGEDAVGHLTLGQGDARWRARQRGEDMLLSVVATRPVQAAWHGEARGGRWRLEIRLAHAE